MSKNQTIMDYYQLKIFSDKKLRILVYLSEKHTVEEVKKRYF